VGGFEGGEGGRGYGLADRVAVGGFGDDGAGWEGLASTAERGAAGGDWITGQLCRRLGRRGDRQRRQRGDRRRAGGLDCWCSIEMCSKK
jgi:hypothetical protein